LNRLDIQVTPAGSGKEALEVFSTDIFDLVLLDLELPDMDGSAVASALRELELDVAHTPIYALRPPKQRRGRSLVWRRWIH